MPQKVLLLPRLMSWAPALGDLSDLLRKSTLAYSRMRPDLLSGLGRAMCCPCEMHSPDCRTVP